MQRANRHDADRVIVGEVLGDEIVPMLNAMTAGKAGSMCTIHADSTEGTFGKIKTYASQSPKHLTDNAAAQLTAQALDLVIFVRKRPDASGLARRYVSSVRVVEDSDGPHVISTEIFAEPDGGGPAVHHLRLPPGLRDRLADVGYEAPLERVRTMTPVVVLFGAGIGAGIALLDRRHLVHRFPRGANVDAEAARPRQPPSGGVCRGSRRRRRARHPLAGGCRHRCRGRLDAALRPAAHDLAPRGRAPGGPGHVDRGAPRRRGGPSGSAGRHRIDRFHAPQTLVKANVAGLVARIESGTPLDKALYAFAQELGDAAVDEAIAPLILASRFGGSDLQHLLGSAAANTRDQIALWQRTEVARARPRRDMRLVIAVTLAFTLGILVIGHGYFRPFGTPAGQIALLVVASLFAAGFAAMNRLSRPVPMPRLFDGETTFNERHIRHWRPN